MKVNEERDLGIIISNNFKVLNQCVMSFNKGKQILGLIKKIITYKDHEIILTLYKSVVWPYLVYCIQAWRPHLINDIEMLKKSSEVQQD